jgi:hypothetical protein
MNVNLSLPQHLRNTKRDRERRRELKRTRRHRQKEKAVQAARSRGVPEHEVREQEDPLGQDPLVMRAFAAVDTELEGPDPCDRMRWSGEPGPCHCDDPKTEAPRDPVTEFARDPGIQIAEPRAPEGSVDDSLFERATGVGNSGAGLSVESALNLKNVEKDLF